MDGSKHGHGRVALFTALLAFLSTVTPIVCRAQTQSSPSPMGSSSNSSADQSKVEKYWTPERMRAAKPMELHPKIDVQPPPTAGAADNGNAPPTGGSGQPPNSVTPK